MSRLPIAHRRLADHYLALNCHIGNAARACDWAYASAQKVLASEPVQRYLEQRQTEISAALTVTATEVISTLTRHLRADIADIMPDEPIVQAARAAGVSALIKKIKVKTSTRRSPNGEDEIEDKVVEIELHDAQRAANSLAKIFGLTGEDDLAKARSAIRLYCELQQCPPDVAVVALASHIPAVLRVRDEFCGRPQLAEGGGVDNS